MQLQDNIQIEFPERSGIYAIVNTINDKHYVVSAVNFKIRRRLHFNELKRNEHKNSKLQNFWNKNWSFNFIFIILEYCKPDQLIECEQYWIDKLKPEYNILKIAGSVLGHKHDDETRAKMSANQNRSEETRKRRSEGQLGRKQSKEHIANMVATKIGFKHSEKTKQQMKDSAKKRGLSDNFKRSLEKYYNRNKNFILDGKCLIRL